MLSGPHPIAVAGTDLVALSLSRLKLVETYFSQVLEISPASRQNQMLIDIAEGIPNPDFQRLALDLMRVLGLAVETERSKAQPREASPGYDNPRWPIGGETTDGPITRMTPDRPEPIITWELRCECGSQSRVLPGEILLRLITEP